MGFKSPAELALYWIKGGPTIDGGQRAMGDNRYIHPTA